MSTSTIIYLASISGNVQFALGMFAFIFFLLCITLVIMINEKPSDYNSKNIYKYITSTRHIMLGGIICSAILTMLLSFCTACIPDSNDVYKMAGITDIQRSNIDASGEIIKNNKDSIIINKQK